jgi:hypothetical protein
MIQSLPSASRLYVSNHLTTDTCSAHLRCVTPAVTRQRPAGVCDGLDGELRRTSKLPLSLDVAYDAIASTLPKGAARWPLERDEPLLRSIRGGAFPFKRLPSFLSAGISWRREPKASFRSLHDAWAPRRTRSADPHYVGWAGGIRAALIVARTSEGRKRSAARRFVWEATEADAAPTS